jgi:alkaline phosphatase
MRDQYVMKTLLRHIRIAIVILSSSVASAQEFTTANVFAHNDYAGDKPFHMAYDLRVGYIEADVFLVDDDLMVAHERGEIRPERTLEELYLRPLNSHILKNNGFAYEDEKHALTLMIDLKTPGFATLNALVACLKKYPDLLSSQTLQIMISGNVPDPKLWKNFPSFIHFDGRPGIEYTPDQLARISMISTNFRSHVQWDGEGTLPAQARATMSELMKTAHSHGKKFRFWATPDFPNAWKELMRAEVDVIATDKVPELVEFLRSQQ